MEKEHPTKLEKLERLISNTCNYGAMASTAIFYASPITAGATYFISNSLNYEHACEAGAAVCIGSFVGGAVLVNLLSIISAVTDSTGKRGSVLARESDDIMARPF